MTTFAVRHALASMEMPLDFHKKKNVIPDSVWTTLSSSAREPDAAGLERSWTRFCRVVEDICRCRRKNQLASRDAVFESGMSNACRSFNQGTETVKVEFTTTILQQESSSSSWTKNLFQGFLARNNKRHHRESSPLQSQSTTTITKQCYALRISCLNAIPQELRNVAFCTADIPNMPPPPVQATRVVAVDNNGDHSEKASQQQARVHVPKAFLEIVQERPIVVITGDTTNDETTAPLVVQVVTIDQQGRTQQQDVPVNQDDWLVDGRSGSLQVHDAPMAFQGERLPSNNL